jgi:hypothetical protein
LDDIGVGYIGYIGFWVLDIWIFMFLILDFWNLEFALNSWNVFG